MNVRMFLLALWLPCAAVAQGFAGLGTSAEGFALPERGYEFSFPRDHGPHNDFRIEWWYVTANLTGPNGTEYGVQWTLFRNALQVGESEGWSSSQVWMGHAALTTPDTHFAAQRYARGGIGQAGALDEALDAWIDDWILSETRMTARGDHFSYDLTLKIEGPVVLNGDSGYSVKSAEMRASQYYSLPFISVEGTLRLAEGDIPVSGSAWLDREWSSQPLAEDQTGWDWFSLSFDDGAKMMGYRLRGGEIYTQATWIEADGTASSFPDGAFSADPLATSDVAGREVPTRWRVILPERGLDIEVAALNPNAWLALDVPYWEGPVQLDGSHTGRGYLEMTGY